MLNAKFASDSMRYLNPYTTLMYLDNTFRQQELYASAAGKYAILPQWDVSLSTDYLWNTLAANLLLFAYPQRSTALAALATADIWEDRLLGRSQMLHLPMRTVMIFTGNNIRL